MSNDISYSISTDTQPMSLGILAERRSPYQANKVTVEIHEIQEPITNASPEVREIIERVLQAEKDKLYMRPPRNINDDILKIIKDVINQ
jgi:hypothetical protein